MSRTPLPENYALCMENGGKYIIKKKIAEGGFSLVYEAETLGGTTPVVIKEYFPAAGAFRNEQNKVLPLVGDEDRFLRYLKRFNNEGFIGGQVAKNTFQAVSFLSSQSGYALMKKNSQDMVSVSDLVAGWSECPPVPYTGSRKDVDPVFTDMTRLKYSLHVIESVLSVLAAIHNSGYLHLDISGSNVIWAGTDRHTGRNCAAFIADYGCSVNLTNGICRPDYPVSCSRGFAAPEIQKKRDQLTPATDIYSVGVLLFFLCIGDAALDASRNKKRQIEREIPYLKVPQRMRDRLAAIIYTATADEPSRRYQSACEMQEEICRLDEMIPAHPINPDNTRSFTLYSLKSMLEGSRETHYSWAHELCDRRKVTLPVIKESIFEPLTWKSFPNNEDFLYWVLPEELFQAVKEKIDSSSDRRGALLSIMTGNYPSQWKRSFCHVIQKYGLRRFLVVSRTALDNESVFFEDQSLLFQIMGEEGERLQDCYYSVAGSIRNAPYIGLTIFTIYSLLGPDGFKEFIPDPSNSDKLKSCSILCDLV